ncbi:MAG: ABC transporter ATP-binding protein [Armatimonadota bacterium]
MAIIQVDRLSKTYVTHKREQGALGALKSLVTRQKVEVHAVQEVSFTIEEGELVGFLGPNGAGKTTTLKMLSGILYPTSGRATVMGYVPWERKPAFQRQMSIVMGQKMQLWWDLPAYESFILLKELYEVDDRTFERRVNELAEMLDIKKLLHTQVRRMSLGERMKCELLAALLHAPKVVFLDEPTIGLDVVSQKRIREFLKEYNRQAKTTILLTSHYMQDIQELCERVIIIDHGRIIFDNTLQTLVEQYSDSKLLKLTFDRPVAREQLERFGVVCGMDDLRAVIEVPRVRTTQIASQVLSELPVVDIVIDEVEAEEVIRDIFAGRARLSTHTSEATVG